MDLLRLFDEHGVRYLIVGGMAVAFHGSPRYTRDMDLWVDPSPENVERANRALAEFGSPWLLDADKPTDIVQVGVEPQRVDVLLKVEGVCFETAWPKRVRGRYGDAPANWMDIESLIRSKEHLEGARHQEDVRNLRETKNSDLRSG